jgi:hypothetical protein
LSLERNHWVSVVWDSNVGEGRDGSRDGIGTEEAEDTELSQAAIVELSDQATFLGLLSHVLVEAQGIVQVKDGVDNVTEPSERGELSGLAALGVVGKVTSTTFIPKLERRDDGENLPLGTDGDGIPLSLRGELSRRMGGSGHGLGPGEDDVGLDDVSNERKHGNAAVLLGIEKRQNCEQTQLAPILYCTHLTYLDLGLAKEADGGLVSESVEIGFSEVQRIIELDNRVGLLGKSLQVSLGGTDRGGGSSLSGRSEGGGASGDRGKNKSRLHF